MIGFRVEADPVTELPLHADYVPLVLAGKNDQLSARAFEGSRVTLLTWSLARIGCGCS